MNVFTFYKVIYENCRLAIWCCDCSFEGFMTIQKFFKTNAQGIFLCIAVSIPAYYMGTILPVVGGPVFAILLGMILALLIKDRTKIQSGIVFTAKKILQYAVIFLGFGLNISTIFEKGVQSLPIILVTISTSLVVAFGISKLFKMPSKVSTLIGVGSSICGGSAIAAAAPVINADDGEIAQAISVIFLCNVLAALIFPTLGGIIGLSNEGFGLFAGTAVNDTSSVTAAASAWDGLYTDAKTLEDATIVKLTRTLAIIPITLALAFLRMYKEKKLNVDADSKNSFNFFKIFPFFVIWFILASVITTVCNLNSSITLPLKFLSKFFIIMAMSAIGLNINIVKLVKSGVKPIFLGFLCWLSISIVSLIMQHCMGIW